MRVLKSVGHSKEKKIKLLKFILILEPSIKYEKNTFVMISEMRAGALPEIWARDLAAAILACSLHSRKSLDS